jgi:hypothetical protein
MDDRLLLIKTGQFCFTSQTGSLNKCVCQKLLNGVVRQVETDNITILVKLTFVVLAVRKLTYSANVEL